MGQSVCSYGMSCDQWLCMVCHTHTHTLLIKLVYPTSGWTKRRECRLQRLAPWSRGTQKAEGGGGGPIQPCIKHFLVVESTHSQTSTHTTISTSANCLDSCTSNGLKQFSSLVEMYWNVTPWLEGIQKMVSLASSDESAAFNTAKPLKLSGNVPALTTPNHAQCILPWSWQEMIDSALKTVRMAVPKHCGKLWQFSCFYSTYVIFSLVYKSATLT